METIDARRDTTFHLGATEVNVVSTGPGFVRLNTGADDHSVRFGLGERVTLDGLTWRLVALDPSGTADLVAKFAIADPAPE